MKTSSLWRENRKNAQVLEASVAREKSIAHTENILC